MGVLTGDSMSWPRNPNAHQQEFQMLRDSALKLGIRAEDRGGCSITVRTGAPLVQILYLIGSALRVSRSSSALTSKAGLSHRPRQREDRRGSDARRITSPTPRLRFEPTLDYVVTRSPASPSISSPTLPNKLGLPFCR